MSCAMKIYIYMKKATTQTTIDPSELDVTAVHIIEIAQNKNNKHL